MQYITEVYALNLPCSLATCGDWHCSALQWKKPRFRDSEDSFFGDYGIEQCSAVPENEGVFAVANHIRALLDLIEVGNFSTAQGMNRDYIGNDIYTEEIFSKVALLKKLPHWDKIDSDINKGLLPRVTRESSYVPPLFVKLLEKPSNYYYVVFIDASGEDLKDAKGMQHLSFCDAHMMLVDYEQVFTDDADDFTEITDALKQRSGCNIAVVMTKSDRIQNPDAKKKYNESIIDLSGHFGKNSNAYFLDRGLVRIKSDVLYELFYQRARPLTELDNNEKNNVFYFCVSALGKEADDKPTGDKECKDINSINIHEPVMWIIWEHLHKPKDEQQK